jgi:hypothetical protein
LNNTEIPLETQLDLGSHVVLLKIPRLQEPEDKTRFPAPAAAMNSSIIENFTNLQLGAPVTAHGCPFGALVSLKFHNFVVSGAISALLENKRNNQAQSHQPPLAPVNSVVALSDLKLLPGMEGGAVYTPDSKQLIGILGPPLRAPEAHAQLSIIISVRTILNAVGQTLRENNQTTSNFLIKHSISTTNTLDATRETTGKGLSLFNEAVKAVVAVEAKNGWASGVLVSNHGHILTNAHALPPVINSLSSSSTSQVRVLVNKSWVDAEIVHIFSAPIDLAVLKIKSNNNNNIKLPVPVKLGDDSGFSVLSAGRSVAVVGYPLWRPSTSHLNPSTASPVVTIGTAALLVPAAPAMPAVMLTTADVHAGASGGAVLDLETGCLVGLVTSNTRLGRSGSRPPPSQQQQQQQPPPTSSNNSNKGPILLFPHLNYCLGSAVLSPVIHMLTAAAEEEGGEFLQNLDWRGVETKLEESGAVNAWHSMRSMENLGTLPNKQLIKRKLPPALAALIQSKNGGNGSGGGGRPKL